MPHPFSHSEQAIDNGKGVDDGLVSDGKVQVAELGDSSRLSEEGDSENGSEAEAEDDVETEAALREAEFTMKVLRRFVPALGADKVTKTIFITAGNALAVALRENRVEYIKVMNDVCDTKVDRYHESLAVVYKQHGIAQQLLSELAQSQTWAEWFERTRAELWAEEDYVVGMDKGKDT